MGVRDLTVRDGHPDCWGGRLAGRGRRTAAAASEVAAMAGEPEPAVAEAGSAGR